MGCFASKSSNGRASSKSKKKGTNRDDRYALPKWTSPEPLTQTELERKREEYWDTAPHYGGDRVIWDALKAAVEADPATRQAIIESAGIVVGPPNLTVCYDERGAKYELPNYVLSAPTNLQADGAAPPFQTSHATQAELMGR